MMTRFKQHEIYSKEGEYLGVVRAVSRAHALMQIHRAAGYPCSVVDGRIQFKDPEAEKIRGNVEVWTIEEIPQAYVVTTGTRPDEPLYEKAIAAVNQINATIDAKEWYCEPEKIKEEIRKYSRAYFLRLKAVD